MPLFVTMDAATVAGVLGVFVLGGMVKGALGFGLPLTTMAMLPFLIPVEAALALNILMLVFTNIAQLIQIGRVRETVVAYAPVLWGTMLGVPAGAAMVSVFSDNALLGALGVMVLAFSALSLAAPNLSIPASRARPVGWGVGIAAGTVSALTTVGGPLYVMYLVGLRTERDMFLSGLSLLFIFSASLVAVAFLWLGLFDAERLALFALAFPAALLGMGAGNWLGKRLSAERFRAVVLLALAVLGANLLWRALAGG